MSELQHLHDLIDSDPSDSSDSSSPIDSEEESEDEGIDLHDGVNHVDEITVVSLFRNNAKYLKDYLLPRFDVLEEMYSKNKWNYVFVENNSKDDTREVLTAFASTRQDRSEVITMDLPEFQNLGVNFARTDRLASLRNAALDAAMRTRRLADKNSTGHWFLFIDSDICFDVNSLESMFSKQPAKNNVGLMSAFTVEALFGRQVKNLEQFKNVRDDEVICFNHYADTFALVTMDSKNYRPKCPFKSCKMCGVNILSKDSHENSLLDVKSCYNGFCLVDGSVAENKHVRWGTIDIEGKISLCEHVLFCHSLRAATGKRVCIATDVDKVFWTNP